MHLVENKKFEGEILLNFAKNNDFLIFFVFFVDIL